MQSHTFKIFKEKDALIEILSNDKDAIIESLSKEIREYEL